MYTGLARDRVTIESSASLKGTQCSAGPEGPKRVTLTCRADQLVTVFWWINKDPKPIARYTNINAPPQLPLNISTSLTENLGFITFITEVVPHSSQTNNYTTTLHTTIQNLIDKNISRIWCGYNFVNTSIAVSLSIRGNVVPMYHE